MSHLPHKRFRLDTRKAFWTETHSMLGVLGVLLSAESYRLRHGLDPWVLKGDAELTTLHCLVPLS